MLALLILLTCVGFGGPENDWTIRSRINLHNFPPAGNPLKVLKGFSKVPLFFLIGYIISVSSSIVFAEKKNFN